MKIKISAIIFLSLICIMTNGQADSNTFGFVAYWSQGDSYDFKVTKIQKRWKEGVLIKNDSTQVITNFKVQQETDSLYQINWSFKNNLANTYDLPDTVLESLSDYAIMEVLYNTTELGEYIGITNWEEIRDIMQGLFKIVFTAVAEQQGEDPDEMLKMAEPVLAIYNSKQGVEQLVFPELQSYYYNPGVPIKIETLRETMIDIDKEKGKRVDKLVIELLP
jgi:hypothetical protein